MLAQNHANPEIRNHHKNTSSLFALETPAVTEFCRDHIPALLKRLSIRRNKIASFRIFSSAESRQALKCTEKIKDRLLDERHNRTGSQAADDTN